jgi:hypothetical protein
MRFELGDAPELTRFLLGTFLPTPPKAVVAAMQRFLWNGDAFSEAVSLDEMTTSGDIRKAGTFVYHKHSGLVFTHVAGGKHQMLMAHLGALHKTDFTNDCEDWQYDQFYPWDATSQLADDFVCLGFGFFLSSVSSGGRITVALDYPWSSAEERLFGGFELDRV